MYDFYNVEILKDIVGIMLCVILSDIVIFKLLICIMVDIKCVEVFVEIVGIEDFKEFGMEMFKVKLVVEGMLVCDLVMCDFKDFNMNGKLVGIG